MSTTKHWELLPNTDFRNRMSWRELGNNRFAALRVRLLIVMREDSESKYGSVVNAYHIAAGADSIKVRRRREQVISRTTTISEAIRFTATSRVCDSLATKVSSELSAKAAGFSGKLGSEILAKSEYELTKTAENILTTTTSHSIQQTTEEEQEITMAAGTVARDVKLRRRYWPRRWAVYLHSYDYLELSFKKKWFWWQVIACFLGAIGCIVRFLFEASGN